MRIPLWCRHDWKVRAVTYYMKYAWLTDRKPDPVKIELGERTSVLQVCTKCGDPRSRELQGVWTLEDLQRVPTAREIAKSLGVQL